MPLPVASLPPPTAPVPRFSGASETETVDSGTLEFRQLWQDKADGLTFADVLDIVNPLQHIPVVSTLYRAITGDGLGLGARLIGGALYGGGVGLALGAAQAAVEEATGKDLGANMMAFVQDLTGGGPDAPQAPAAAAVAGTEAEPAALSAIAPAAGPSTAPAAQPAAPAPAQSPPAAAPLPAPPPAAAPARPGADQIAVREFPARDEKPRPVLGASPSEKARIAEAVERARRAQAATLLANTVDALPEAAADAEAADETAKDAKPAAAAPAAARTPAPQPVHPNMIPAGASPQWITQAMERALNKYEDTLRLRSR